MAERSTRHRGPDFREHKALANPLRLQMLPHFVKPMTVKQVADAMGIRPHNLYHHIKVMEKCGVVKLIRREKLNGSIEEKYYQLAKKYRIGNMASFNFLQNADGALDHTLSVIEEYRRSAKSKLRPPCHNCSQRLQVRSEDKKRIQESLSSGIEKLVAEYLEPFNNPEGDATFVFNSFSFIK